MKIGIIGYGKMGKTITQLAQDMGHEVVEKFHSKNPFLEVKSVEADVLIEFTRPELAVPHIHKALELKTPIVVGTTAWDTPLNQIEQDVNKQQGTLFHASNFSIGVHLFFTLNQYLAKWISPYDYQPSIHEIHHLQKLDAPSGTAITTKERIQQGQQKANPEITHDRQPDVPGTHIVHWENNIDKLTLTHEAKNRNGFALGAIKAAEFIQSKKGVFTMDDLIQIEL